MLQTLRTYLRYTSWPIIAAMAALTVIGVLTIRVSDLARLGREVFCIKQAIYACVAMAAFLLATAIPYRRLGAMAYALFGGTLGLLVLVFFLPPIEGVHRWINLRFMLVQPSEIAKLTYVVLLAWHLRRGESYRRLRGLAAPFLLTLAPMLLVLKEPDLGTSLIFLPTLYFMLFMAGAKIRHLLGIVLVGTVLVLAPIISKAPDASAGAAARNRAALAYVKFNLGGRQYMAVPACIAAMEPHQTSRIVGWIHQADPSIAQQEGYQLHRAKMTLASGHWLGSYGSEGEVYSRMLPLLLPKLPADHTDFIFSVLGGRWGFAGLLAVFFLYAVIFIFGVEIATTTHDPFGRLLAVGVLGLLLTQIAINVSMTLGLMPITGMTLPLVSYGGSSLVINAAALGLLVNVGQRRPILLSRRPFEFAERTPKDSMLREQGRG